MGKIHFGGLYFEEKHFEKIHFWKIHLNEIHFGKIHFRKANFGKIHFRKIHFRIEPLPPTHNKDDCCTEMFSGAKFESMTYGWTDGPTYGRTDRGRC